jgi:hypothetical protein
MVLVSGCSDKQKSPSSTDSAPVKREAKVVVPPEVQGQWKAVRIAVFNKESRKETVYTVDIGSSFRIKSTSLTLKVLYFLPAFIMDGTVMTSVSNELKNPAALVEVRDHDKQIFKGWLFSLYPGAHPFQHPNYSYTLVDFVPVQKNELTEPVK